MLLIYLCILFFLSLFKFSTCIFSFIFILFISINVAFPNFNFWDIPLLNLESIYTNPEGTKGGKKKSETTFRGWLNAEILFKEEEITFLLSSPFEESPGKQLSIRLQILLDNWMKETLKIKFVSFSHHMYVWNCHYLAYLTI